MNVESQEDAGRLLKKLRMKESNFDHNKAVQEEKARLEQADLRLREEKMKPKSKSKKPNVVKVKKQDAKRQEKFEKSKKKAIKTTWRIPEDTTRERFQNDIVNRGMQFCLDKYTVDADDIYAEAERLKLDIKWELVRK